MALLLPCGSSVSVTFVYFVETANDAATVAMECEQKSENRAQWYHFNYLEWSLTIFQGCNIFNVKYLDNVNTAILKYSYIYNGRPIKSYIWSIEWCHFQWPRVTAKLRFQRQTQLRGLSATAELLVFYCNELCERLNTRITCIPTAPCNVTQREKQSCIDSWRA